MMEIKLYGEEILQLISGGALTGRREILLGQD
jgi:hypothetical protein